MYPCSDLDSSGEHSPHAHAYDRAIAATLMKAVYGLDITEEYIQLFADAFSSSDILLNGSILDFLPVLARVVLIRRFACFYPGLCGPAADKLPEGGRRQRVERKARERSGGACGPWRR